MNLQQTSTLRIEGILLLVFASILAAYPAQLSQPRRENLLNGLKILMWRVPGDRVELLLRVHSGSAFDVEGKAGSMALLAESLFPDPETRQYVAEELEGRLEVKTSHDFIEVALSGRSSDLVRLIELLRTALLSEVPSEARVEELKKSRMETLKDEERSLAAVADRAVAARLFGKYPYGRPVHGTTTSLENVERGDLILARQRFLHPNNSTLTIYGGLDERMVTRAARQLLGTWTRSNRIVPATFVQPDPAPAETFVLNFPDTDVAALRIAARAPSRSDSDWATTLLLASIARQRWLENLAPLGDHDVTVTYEAFFLAGRLLFSADLPVSDLRKALTAARQTIDSLKTRPASAAELDLARSEIMKRVPPALKPEETPVLWLDADTYRLSSAGEPYESISAVRPTDIQRIATKFFVAGNMATVVAGDAAELTALLRAVDKTEATRKQIEN